MSKLKVGLLVAAVLVVAALAGGLVGAGAAIALIKTAYNGPTESLAVTEIVVHSEALGGLFVNKTSGKVLPRSPAPKIA